MEKQNQHCSLKKHSEIDAINYCKDCQIYLCNKCQSHHSELFENHILFNLDKDINDIFTGYCKEEKHLKYELEFYCKLHNKLCCAACISKIKSNVYGQHKDCEVCFIKDIADEKKNKLKDNIKCLEDLYDTFKNSINEIKIEFEKINEKKEQLKFKIIEIFTKIRNTLNEREDELILEVDNLFNEIYMSENIVRESEKLPNKIKVSLEKGKKINKEWIDENKLNSLIYECINIENNIQKINKINENIKKYNKNNKYKVKFNLDEDEKNINIFLKTIKTLGEIYYNNFKFKICPTNISEERKYTVTGNNQNILTKTGTDNNWIGTISEYKLQNNIEYKWKVKILKTKKYDLMVGVAPIDFNINSSMYNTCGWYFHCLNSKLWSGPPHKYSGVESNIKQMKNSEIIIVMNMKNGTLKFIVNNQDIGVQYSNIPLDKPLFPAVLLYNINDSVEIEEF